MTTEEAPLHIHILGICGTFMGGLALIARQLGYKVTGSDQNVYPPMSTQLQEQGIELMEGYRPENLLAKPDLVVIGNALSRGNEEVEAVLDQGFHYVSGPQWLAEHVLHKKWVLGVAGTHGKTTTSSMLAWILEAQGFNPGFLIGGIPLNFGLSARLGESDFFVIEADEYDSAFFDKRSKFVHYRPRTCILNNLEYDHADIFPDLEAIKTQFHHLVRTIPGQGLIITPHKEENIRSVLAQGCWTPVVKTAINQAADWRAKLRQPDGGCFEVFFQDQSQGVVDWSLTGEHNVYNALAAIAAARHVGIAANAAIEALRQFKNVKRRMEQIISTDRITVYDDFAHHPTAIATTLDGLRKQVGSERIIAVLEPRSNTMRMGVHSQTLADSLKSADLALVYQPAELDWDLSVLLEHGDNIRLCTRLEEITEQLQTETGAHAVLMSNGGFGGIYQKLQAALQPE